MQQSTEDAEEMQIYKQKTDNIPAIECKTGFNSSAMYLSGMM